MKIEKLIEDLKIFMENDLKNQATSNESTEYKLGTLEAYMKINDIILKNLKS
jgi:hypothetical protein